MGVVMMQSRGVVVSGTNPVTDEDEPERPMKKRFVSPEQRDLSLVYEFLLASLVLLLIPAFITDVAPFCCILVFATAWILMVILDVWAVIDNFTPNLANPYDVTVKVILPLVLVTVLGIFLMHLDLFTLILGMCALLLTKTGIVIVSRRRFQT